MRATDTAAERLIRLPVWAGLDETQQGRVIEALDEVLPD
jgi:dTDP-4-amino-4,6-dideoxygalactose transaminase